MRTALTLIALAALAACSSKVPVETKPAAIDTAAPAPAPAAGAKTDPRAVAPVAVDPLNDPQSPLAKRSVYFDFDSYAVKADYQGTVDAHGKYLASRADRKVSIEGNCDERGTREYNLALGQKRAEAVRKALTLVGAADGQLEAVSFGKEKPKATGHDEASWAENRRADLRYQ
ncbi:peptidoglycan-associated lipoprotein Pal [Derxia gummosa]|uniref:Peptidoglycan-associated lipoprotein n=1 Tax=Derxia gummosa DSM 723 TaxID=1121388 RepID=A0A8B6X826_9BURK|nr:peptidoglycan-associated lipoprotein Pal [Derxia gummosa]